MRSTETKLEGAYSPGLLRYWTDRNFQGDWHDNRQYIFGIESGGLRELHRGSWYRRDLERLWRRCDQSRATFRRSLEIWESRPALPGGEGSLSVAPGQSEQARHDARPEIAGSSADRRETRQVGRRV